MTTFGAGTFGSGTFGGIPATSAEEVTTYLYAGDAAQPNEWYVALFAGYAQNVAGANEAGFVNTSGQPTAGEAITDMIATKNRLVVFYSESSQLWQIGSLPTDNAFLDAYPFGSDGGAVLFHNRPLFLSQRGFRVFELAGLQYESIEDVGIGEDVQDLGTDQTVLAAAFWPWTGFYVTAVTLTNPGALAERLRLPADSPLQTSGTLDCLLFYSFSRQREVRAWSYGTLAEAGDIVAMWPEQERLYWRTSAGVVGYFDANGASADFDWRGDQVFHGYGDEERTKRFLRMTLVQQGSAAISFNFTPHFVGDALAGAPISGISTARADIALAMTGTSLAAAFSRVGERTGAWQLERFRITGTMHDR